MLPPKLLWRDPRPIPRDDPRDIVVRVVLDPDYYEPSAADNCTSFGYVCLSHDRSYSWGGCGEGPHLLALDCSEHGYENLGPQPIMHLFPDGFMPPLTRDQLTEVGLDLYPEGYEPPWRAPGT
ncbi:hypothetical protein [Embleya sp. AB8]|uniref:hypothetical protein n=1 Tax=Embleya sp. AB8 TaxID=3156304 RepID=UPI003C70EC1D